ncbi:caspase family protein [Altererythrobacter sp.]|uniref:caspase family protein n=2 Tax=Altererythrobacter sp. TaxID=1872480 RepID=UPI003424E915
MMLRMLGKIFVAASLLFAFIPTAVAAQEKMALLIGNSKYEQHPDGYSWSALPNPVNDVEVVGEALEAIDFAVTVVSNGTKAEMSEALDRFSAESADAEVVIFYFAGHGFEYDRRNFLVPIDAPIKVGEHELEEEFVDFEKLASRLSHAGTMLFILDACRTGSDFVGPGQGVEGFQPTSRSAPTPIVMTRATTLGGGQPIQPASAGVNDYDFPPGANVAVLFSTGRGVPAYDAAPPPTHLSPFALEVSRFIGLPKIEVSSTFNAIRQGVYDRTKVFSPPQAPYTYNSLPPRVYLSENDARNRNIDLEQTEGLNVTLEEMARTDENILILRVLAEHTVEEIQWLADNNDPVATYFLGYMQEFGIGVPRDLEKARATLEKAAAFETPYGELELAYFLHHNGKNAADRQRAVSLYESAAGRDFAKARAHYARVLMAGVLVEQSPENYRAGLEQLKQATESKYPYAFYALALADGAENQAKWIGSLEALRQDGDVDADHWLCVFNVQKTNYDIALPLCENAAEAGYADAQAYLARANHEGWVSEPSPRLAKHWMRQAISSPDLPAGLCAQLLTMRMELGDVGFETSCSRSS